MHKYCCVSYETRDQHKDITSRYSRDACDTIDQIDYRNGTDPFVQIDSLLAMT